MKTRVIVAVRRVAMRIQRKWREGHIDAERDYRRYDRFPSNLTAAGLPDCEGMRILDVGCGDRAGLSLLFSSLGADVTSIDLLPVYIGWRRPMMWVQLLRLSGPRSAGMQVARDLLHTWRYWKHLESLLGMPLPFEKVHFERMNAERLRFPDSSFDVVISSDVWEHLRNVEAATQEVNRVLKPGGVALIKIDLFASLHGGHHAEWHSLEHDPERLIRPWDHLLLGARPLPLYCNGWRESQYRVVFEEEMHIAQWEAGTIRGREYLTAELRAELSDFSDRDLLLRDVTVHAMKRLLPYSSALASGPGEHRSDGGESSWEGKMSATTASTKGGRGWTID